MAAAHGIVCTPCFNSEGAAFVLLQQERYAELNDVFHNALLNT
jgi:hypothetical protein